ncbi:MAG: hypothetical protein GY936_13425 [Ignavibacteriae bacterium]|nr:hypothetical protein [Ignavibacteriota bacterium]
MKIINFASSIFLILLLSFCSEDNNPVDTPETGNNESEVVTVKTNENGRVSTPSGIGLQVIAGTVPQNENGNAASVSFSIESPVDAPIVLGSAGEFVGSLVKYGPEGFNFRWPVEMVLPYPENESPENLYVVHYDQALEDWRITPKSRIDATKKLVYFNAINLGIYGLAKFPVTSKTADDRLDYDGGFQFTGSSQYYYTLTVAAVNNYKYPYQASWPGNPAIGLSASSGIQTTTSAPIVPCNIILLQASYQIWISRTTPGTMSTLPSIETYSLPASGTIDNQLSFTQSGSGSGWETLSLPSGGSWVEGTPDGWPVPTVTFGTGEFQATLTWVNNSSHTTDLDLHLYGPNEMHVYWSDEKSADGSFALDRDWTDEQGNAIENIYSLGTMPTGQYSVKVVLFDGSPVNYNVRILRAGSVKTFNGRAATEDQEITIDTFTK